MKLARGILLVLAGIAATVLAIRATYLNVSGRPEVATSVALGIAIAVANLTVLAIIISVIVGRIQRLIVRLLGPDSELGSTLDELRLITWEGDVREIFRRHDGRF